MNDLNNLNLKIVDEKEELLDIYEKNDSFYEENDNSIINNTGNTL